MNVIYLMGLYMIITPRHGINRRSPLLDVPYFSMFNGGLAHDIMHDVLEGVAPLEMSLLLWHCIFSEKYFSLNDYNYRLTHFDFDYTETSKPSPICSRSILADRKALKLSASQSLVLMRILPLLIGDLIPRNDPNWKCFMKLAKLVDIIMCPWSSADLCAVLKLTIEEHHKSFIALYTESAVIPKFHFLLHYPKQILNVGPMVRTWNMRNEAKLNLFKQTSRLGNFKNISFSIANRHQRLLCYELSTANILNMPMECGPCDQPLPMESEPQCVQDAVQLLLPTASSNITIAHPTWVKLLGTTLKRNAYIITGCDGLHPTFAKIFGISVVLDIVLLRVSHCTVEYFDDHYHAYAVVGSADQSYVCFNQLTDHSVLHVHKIGDTLYVYLKHYFHVL